MKISSHSWAGECLTWDAVEERLCLIVARQRFQRITLQSRKAKSTKHRRHGTLKSINLQPTTAFIPFRSYSSFVEPWSKNLPWKEPPLQPVFSLFSWSPLSFQLGVGSSYIKLFFILFLDLANANRNLHNVGRSTKPEPTIHVAYTYTGVQNLIWKSLFSRLVILLGFVACMFECMHACAGFCSTCAIPHALFTALLLML